jgi:hypothetical protein
MTPKVEEGDVLMKQREDGMIARLKMFIHLRQDLERASLLCCNLFNSLEGFSQLRLASFRLLTFLRVFT